MSVFACSDLGSGLILTAESSGEINGVCKIDRGFS